MSLPTHVAPVAEMRCMTDEAAAHSSKSEASASVRKDIPLDAELSTAEAKLATQATCEPTSDTKATPVAYESRSGSSIERILSHRHDPNDDTCFHMYVHWEDGTVSWKPEIHLQKHHAPTLFAYWNSVEGGREGVMNDPGLWHVFRIISHKRKPNGNISFHVAWVGSPEYSWEPEATIRDADSKLVEQYWDSTDGCRKAVKRPGRSNSVLLGGTRAMEGNHKRRRDRGERRTKNNRMELRPQYRGTQLRAL